MTEIHAKYRLDSGEVFLDDGVTEPPNKAVGDISWPATVEVVPVLPDYTVSRGLGQFTFLEDQPYRNNAYYAPSGHVILSVQAYWYDDRDLTNSPQGSLYVEIAADGRSFYVWTPAAGPDYPHLAAGATMISVRVDP